MGKIKELLIKYKELVLYVVFGVLTTVVSYASYWIFTDFLHIPYMVSTALSWVLSVTFAYVTNRNWVLHVNDKIVKLVANIFVILANYILSKLVVFRKKK